QDRNPAGRGVADAFGEPPAQGGMRRGRVRGGRVLPRADRPDGLVGDDDARHPVGIQPFECGVELAEDDRLDLPRLALLERLSEADDRGESAVQRRCGLAPYVLVRLAEDVAALRVSD